VHAHLQYGWHPARLGVGLPQPRRPTAARLARPTSNHLRGAVPSPRVSVTSQTDGSETGLHNSFLTREPHSFLLDYPLAGHLGQLRVVSQRVGGGLLLSLSGGAAWPAATTPVAEVSWPTEAVLAARSALYLGSWFGLALPG
jgi:hypothetical protein